MSASRKPRNLEAIERIERSSVEYPLRFVVAGDSGAWSDPTAEGIFAQLVKQIGELEPWPAFFANLGDFAGPGTLDRHEEYLELVGGLPIPDICVVGNHDLDDPSGLDSFERVHGPTNFDFTCGDHHFVVLHSQPGVVGEIDIVGADSPEGLEGPRKEDLEFLAETLGSSAAGHAVVLMHMPPFMEGHYAPHDEWGFKQREREFLDILHANEVRLVCCAHGLAFDEHVYEGIRFVMSGGGGSGLCSHLRGVCSAGEGRPEDRGALFHAVEIALAEDGAVSGRVMQAFDAPGEFRVSFG